MAGILFGDIRLVLRNSLNLGRNSAVVNVFYPEMKKSHQKNRFLSINPKKNATKLFSNTITARSYSKHHGKTERGSQNVTFESDSDSDSDTECHGLERSNFWRRKMRTVHNIFDVDKDGLVSYNDWLLFADRFKALGHLDETQGREFGRVIKLTWQEQWGSINPYNLVSVEQYISGMNHALNDKALKARSCRWLPYLFQAVDKDKSGYISLKEFKLFYKCMGLDHDHATVAFAVIDTNADGKLSLKEFVKLGKDFFFTNDQTRVSKMFWGPLIDD